MENIIQDENELLQPLNEKKKRQPINHNVFWCFICYGIWGIADSLWTGAILAVYLQLITGSQEYVGYVEAMIGISGLVTALPIGYLADKYGRTKILTIGAYGMILSAILTVILVIWVDNTTTIKGQNMNQKAQLSFWAFMLIMSIWGVIWGILNGPLSALYADSIPQGYRSKYYVQVTIISLVASSTGTGITIFIFDEYGDDWNMLQMRNIIIVAMVVECITGLTLFMFDDKYAINEQDESQIDDVNNLNQECNVTPYQIKYKKYIPHIIIIQDVIIALGSGMTIKFFPLYFKSDCNFSPLTVQWIYFSIPLVMSITAHIAQKVSLILGRVQTMIILQYSSISALFFIYFMSSYLEKHPYVLIPLFVIRSAVINSTYPIEQSILMDNVSKDQRARWKSLESIGSVGWCGSAALGGILAKNYDYSFTFVITAILQLIGSSLLLFLLPLVSKNENKNMQNEINQCDILSDTKSGNPLQNQLMNSKDNEKL